MSRWSKARWWALIAQVMMWIAVALVLQPSLLEWLLLWMLAAVCNFYGRTAELEKMDQAVIDELKIARERRRRAASATPRTSLPKPRTSWRTRPPPPSGPSCC